MPTWTLLPDFVLLLGAWIVGCNALAPFVARRLGRNVSTVPLVGALLLGAGLYSKTGSWAWALAAVPLDVGTLAFVFGLPGLLRELRATSVRRLHRFVAREEDRTVTIELLRDSRAVLTFLFDPRAERDPRTRRLVRSGVCGRWSGGPEGFLLADDAGQRRLALLPEGKAYVTVEATSAEGVGTEASLDGVRFDLDG